MTSVHLIAAARPNFMKIAPLYHALKATDWAEPVLIHTGQHYDRNMSDAILEDLGVPEPDFHLGIGSGSHAEQTGNVMIAYEKIDLIGNIMIDSFEMLRDKIESANTARELDLETGSYALVTLHRPSSVDALETLEPIVDALLDAARSLPVVFVAHPRTINGLEKFDLKDTLAGDPNVTLLEPVPDIRFMSLVTGAGVVLTDSGGLQEETSYLGIPCLTLRENTERPITVTLGTDKLVDAESLAANLQAILADNWKKGARPPLWDGATATRAVEHLKRRTDARSG